MKLKEKYKFYYIYMTKNLINGKGYVGFHATNKEYDNYLGSGKILNKAIKKYGKNNFIKGIIEYVNEENWKEKEIYWINELNTFNNGYNLTKGGEGFLGINKGNRNPMFGKKHSKETIKKMKKPKSNNHKKLFSIAKKGKSYEEIYGNKANYMKKCRKIQCSNSRNPNAKKYIVFNSKINKSWLIYGNQVKFCKQYHVSGRTLQLSRKNNIWINNWKCEIYDYNNENHHKAQIY